MSIESAGQQIMAKVSMVEDDPDSFGVLSTGEKIAVALVLDRRDLLTTFNGGYTMLQAFDRLGDDWTRAAIIVQKMRS